MRQVAIFHEKLKDQPTGVVKVDPTRIQSFELNQFSVTTGLLETTDTAFNGALPANRDKVLVRKKAFSCNYRDKTILLTAKQRIDTLATSNQLKYYTLGSEFAGEVVAVGDAVTSFQVGDRVIGNGNYPYSGHEDVRPGLPTNHGSKELEVFHFAKLMRIPDRMPYEVAASFPIGGQTTYSMIRKLQLQKGEKVLVTAATSNTSLFAINALRNLPVKVYALTTRTEFVDRLREMGAEEVFVIKRGLTSLYEDPTIRKFVNEEGLFNAVIDPFFDIYLRQVIDVMDIHGRYTTCGMYGQAHASDKDVIAKLPKDMIHIMSLVMIKNIQLIGNCIGKTDDLERSLQEYAEGKLEVVIDSVFQNGEVSEFFERSFNAPDRFGKVVYKY